MEMLTYRCKTDSLLCCAFHRTSFLCNAAGVSTRRRIVGKESGGLKPFNLIECHHSNNIANSWCAEVRNAAHVDAAKDGNMRATKLSNVSAHAKGGTTPGQSFASWSYGIWTDELMAITNEQAGTRIDEIGDGIYRISTPVREMPGGFSFNQYLLAGEQPMLFHTGPKRMRPLVQEAIASVLDVTELRYIGFSHYESDECGSLNELLRLAPHAEPLCGRVNAMLNGDCFDRPARVLADGETLSLGKYCLRWFDTPHLPHAWECGYLMEETTGTLLCGDLFTQGGADLPPLVTSDILAPSESFRQQMDYYSHTKNVRLLIARLSAAKPTVLACMHGSAWQGDGGQLLSALAERLDS